MLTWAPPAYIANYLYTVTNTFIITGLHGQDVIEQFEDVLGWADQQLIPVLTREVEANQVRLCLCTCHTGLLSADSSAHTREKGVNCIKSGIKCTFLPHHPPHLYTLGKKVNLKGCVRGGGVTRIHNIYPCVYA